MENTIAKTNRKENTNRQERIKPDEVDFIDYLLFVPYYLVFGLLLVITEVIIRIAYPVWGEKAIPFIMNKHVNIQLGLLKLLGVKIIFSGNCLDTNNKAILEKKATLIVSNHQSLFDIPIIYQLASNLKPLFIAKKELAKFIPTVSSVLKLGKHGKIDRSDRNSAVEEIRSVAEVCLKENRAVSIFPEGTRSRDGKLKVFKSGGVSTILNKIPDAQILIVTLDNSWKLTWKKFRPLPRKTKIKVHVEKASYPREKKSEEILNDIENKITKNLLNLNS